MAYAQLADLIARFGEKELIQLTDTECVGEVDRQVVGRALADADAKIDLALRGRYGLPLPFVPRELVLVAADLARELLYSDAPPEVVTQRADEARALLKGIASGSFRLDVPTAETSASSMGLVEIVTGRRGGSPFGDR